MLLISVIVKEYVVEIAGATVIEAVVDPVLHKKTTPPFAVKTVLSPRQTLVLPQMLYKEDGVIYKESSIIRLIKFSVIFCNLPLLWPPIPELEVQLVVPTLMILPDESFF